MAVEIRVLASCQRADNHYCEADGHQAGSVNMKPMNSTRSKAASKRTNEARTLSERARKHPGVAELMEVYEAWRKYEKATEAHNLLRAARQTSIVSSSSEPFLIQAA